jgi:hypothetical protein
MDKLICRQITEDIYECVVVKPNGLIFVEKEGGDFSECLAYCAKVAAQKIFDRQEFKFVLLLQNG